MKNQPSRGIHAGLFVTVFGAVFHHCLNAKVIEDLSNVIELPFSAMLQFWEVKILCDSRKELGYFHLD